MSVIGIVSLGFPSPADLQLRILPDDWRRRVRTHTLHRIDCVIGFQDVILIR